MSLALGLLGEFLIGTVAVMGISAFASYNRKTGRFSTSVFFCSMSIGICVLIWIGLAPVYTVVVSVLLIVAIFFMGFGDSSDE